MRYSRHNTPLFHREHRREINLGHGKKTQSDTEGCLFFDCSAIQNQAARLPCLGYGWLKEGVVYVVSGAGRTCRTEATAVEPECPKQENGPNGLAEIITDAVHFTLP